MKHPRLEQQEHLLEILLSFKAARVEFTIFDILEESKNTLKYGMVNYHLNQLHQEGKIILLKKRIKKIKRYKFPFITRGEAEG